MAARRVRRGQGRAPRGRALLPAPAAPGRPAAPAAPRRAGGAPGGEGAGNPPRGGRVAARAQSVEASAPKGAATGSAVYTFRRGEARGDASMKPLVRAHPLSRSPP